jgi:hypothetical protein
MCKWAEYQTAFLLLGSAYITVLARWQQSCLLYLPQIMIMDWELGVWIVIPFYLFFGLIDGAFMTSNWIKVGEPGSKLLFQDPEHVPCCLLPGRRSRLARGLLSLCLGQWHSS